MNKRTTVRNLLLATGASVGALGFAMPVFAQAGPDTQADQGVQVEELIVTARKREERIQDVPIAVTAVSGATLERQHITSVIDLIRTSPSLTVSPGLGSSRAVPNFSIRGLSQQEQTLLSDPSVTVYQGDIVAARPQGLNTRLIDIGTVEILKGPQGTLFGRNTTGGAIIIRPNRPTDNLEGSLTVTAGNLGSYSTEGVVNIPLNDYIKVRLAAGTENSDGYIRDVLTDENINFTRNVTFRASALIEPNDKVSSYTVFNLFNEDDGGQGSYIHAINPNGSFNSDPARAARNYPTLQSMLAAQQARGDYETASGTPMYTNVKTWDLANTTTYDLTDSISLKNVIGVRSVRNEQYEDTDGLPIPLLEIERFIKQDQFSEEFQILGDTGNLNWIVGGYYFHESGDDQGQSVTGGVDPGVNQPAHVALYPSYSNTWVEGDNTSYAVFAQGTYKLDSLLQGLSFTAGGRYNWDERGVVIKNRTNTACRFTVDNDDNPATPEVNPGLAGCELPLSTKFSEPTYSLTLDWKIDPDTLIYAAHRRGYRTGGFGARAATEAGLRTTFEPETVSDIEVGLKRDWRFGDAFLRTNLAVYTGKYKNIQRLLTNPTTIPVTTVAVNAAEATISGAEFEFLFKPVQFFELSGFYSYTNAGFDEFIAPDGTDFTDNPFARAPKNIYSVTARVNHPLANNMGELSGSLTYFHSDDWWANDDVPALVLASGLPNPAAIYRETFHFPGYGLLNANVEWAHVAGSNVSIGAFIDNITDEVVEWPELNIVTSLGFESRTVGPPRVFGVRVKYAFGAN
jgi:iron complex outermembrane recepter protein